MLQKIKKPLLVILLAVVFLIAWYGPVVWSISRSKVIRTFPRVVAAAPAVYTSDQSLIAYPTIGITAPLTERSDVSPLDVAQWNLLHDDLNHGVSLDYTGTDFTSAPHAFLVGHSSDYYPHPYSAVFAGLGEAQVGDTFQVVVSGHPFTYKVIKKTVLSPLAVASFEAPIAQAIQQKLHLLSVVTCWPPLTTRSRLVVEAQREN